MNKQHDTKQDAKEDFSRQLEEVQDKRWMGVLFWVDDTGHIRMVRTTSEFDRNDYPACVNIFRENCVNEVFGQHQFNPPKLPRFNIIDQDEPKENGEET